jgi:hypothetical protein
MNTICRNCHQQISGHYCSNCGQSANTPDIGPKVVITLLRKAFISFNSGYFYTIKNLLIRPGETLRGYVEGKRINHTNPFSFVLLTAGFYAFLFSHFNIVTFTVNAGTVDAHLLNSWYSSHIASIQLFLIPVFAGASRFVFRKQRYTIYELGIINTFLAGQRLVLNILTFPLLYLFNGTDHLNIITGSTAIIGMAFFIWTYIHLYSEDDRFKVILQSLLTYAILIIFLSLILLAVYSSPAFAKLIFG